MISKKSIVIMTKLGILPVSEYDAITWSGIKIGRLKCVRALLDLKVLRLISPDHL